MSYENASSTALVATNCACCGRPLVDATSVETGVGPECRKKHGFMIEVSEEARQEANKIVYAIAAEQTGQSVAQGCVRLRELGFSKLADRIEKRAVDVRITVQGNYLLVKAPYRESSVVAFQQIRGRRWDREAKANRIPLAAKNTLWTLLKDHYKGCTGMGPKGAFTC